MAKLLKELADPVMLHALTEALQERGIACRIDGAGMQSLLPLPGVMDARVMVEEEAWPAAVQVLRDLGLEEGEHD